MSSSKTSDSKPYQLWDENYNRIRTSMGKWTGGEDVVCHGYSMMNELLGKVSYMQMVILNATGRLVDERVAQWLEGNFIGVSYPDSRIWCNQLGALAATTKTSVVAATVAGTLSADSRGFGGSQTSKIGLAFIQNALKEKNSGKSIKDILAKVKWKNDKPIVTGYARPVARHDERLTPHEKMTEALGFETGPHLQLAYDISDYLEEHYNLAMNIAGYSCAFLSDQGFSPDEMYRIKALMVASGVTASYVDNIEKPADTFLPLRCNDVEYIGTKNREIN